MSHRVLPASAAHWRRSNLMGVLNADLGRPLEAPGFGVRLWRLAPGEASTRHRHRTETELYVVLEGTGRMRAGDELLTLEPLSAVLVEPQTVRQVFNDTDADALWLVVGAPSEFGSVRELSEEDRLFMYPDGPTALPPELTG